MAEKDVWWREPHRTVTVCKRQLRTSWAKQRFRKHQLEPDNEKSPAAREWACHTQKKRALVHGALNIEFQDVILIYKYMERMRCQR